MLTYDLDDVDVLQFVPGAWATPRSSSPLFCLAVIHDVL